jgi:hypothetical protein
MNIMSDWISTVNCSGSLFESFSRLPNRTTDSTPQGGCLVVGWFHRLKSNFSVKFLMLQLLFLLLLLFCFNFDHFFSIFSVTYFWIWCVDNDIDSLILLLSKFNAFSNLFLIQFSICNIRISHSRIQTFNSSPLRLIASHS